MLGFFELSLGGVSDDDSVAAGVASGCGRFVFLTFFELSLGGTSDEGTVGMGVASGGRVGLGPGTGPLGTGPTFVGG